jgi:ferrochelatase
MEQGDPYDSQLRETARLVAEKSGLPSEQWVFSYQSAGRSPEPWLGPQIEALVVELAERGHRHLLSCVVGFVADHVEVLFDIDIKAKQAAENAGAQLERAQSLNDDPLFIAALADLVRQQERIRQA